VSEPNYIHGTAPDEQDRLAALNRMTNAAFIEFLAPEPTAQVLEVGSGLGLLAARVAARVPGGRVTGLEFSPAQLARAPRGVPNLTFIQSDAHALPFPDASFDLVYCRYLLEHVADPLQVLREAWRVLKPGGRVAAQENDISLVRHDPPTPAFDEVWQRFAALQSRLGGDAYVGRRLFRLFRAAGLSEVALSCAPEMYWYGHQGFAPWLENLVGNIRSAEIGLTGAGLCSPSQIAAAIDELGALARNPDGSTFFFWNRATGRRV
jgi:ubiquinone/menaquinone biosynthesis C-methylase UbiE